MVLGKAGTGPILSKAGGDAWRGQKHTQAAPSSSWKPISGSSLAGQIISQSPSAEPSDRVIQGGESGVLPLVYFTSHSEEDLTNSMLAGNPWWPPLPRAHSRGGGVVMAAPHP